jgi:CheY-like chemotaxis protein
LRFLERLLPERIRVELRREPGNAWVEANPAQLQQILTNLLVNARDAIPGDGRITVSVGPVRFGPGGVPVPRMAPGDYTALSVSDTGTGMTPEVRERLFEPFFTTKARGTGTGLGLTQVYGLVEQHRGHIAVESRVGHGTTFTVYLPAASVSAAPEPANGPVNPQGRGRAVLVAEDDASVMAIVQALLERLGFATLAARTGAEALALYGEERGRIALVMTDLAMPEMGGRELCQALKDQDPALPVIGMSGYAQGTDPLACGTHRFDRILTKPMSLKELSVALDAVLDPTH